MKEIPTKMKGYPIGQQDFKTLRRDEAIYVDKTEFIDKIVYSSGKYYFLARPRRFGKSLFLSTLRYFFQGERELFKGLYIDSTGWQWEEYPVLHLDLNMDRYAEKGRLDDVLRNLFTHWEKKYGIVDTDYDYPRRFSNIIKGAHKKTGRQVVVLVDEYDKPLVGNLNKKDNFEYYRSQLASLYSNFKSAAEHIRLVFLTGVSRFSKLSVFSDLNNLNDITFSIAYADICGITEQELKAYFQEGISKLAEDYEISFEEALQLLKRNYDGYRFAARGSEIYNPWSLLNAMEKSTVEYYWNDTGMPTIVAEALKRLNTNLEESFNKNCTASELKGLDLLNPDPTSLMYQTGYLTIKSFNTRLQKYRLGIPNKEVADGLYSVIMPYYVKMRSGSANDAVEGIIDSFLEGLPDKAMRYMQAFFAGIDYKMKIDNENNFHNAFYLLTLMIGLKARTEVHTSDGSIDITIDTDEFLYLIELKYDHSAEEALRQIEEKRYARPWQTGGREIFLIGAAFSSKTRCIEGWTIEKNPPSILPFC
ncbi:MAG: ATP-binding protein [Muribaculaceae bacterium]|nr:ATP-binding protein [Muribaculaceae bacterium]